LSAGVNNLSNKLFKTLIKENPTSNVIISPMSIHFALSMLYYGASKEEKAKLQEYLGLPEVDEKDLLNSTKDLLIGYAEKRNNLSNTNIQLSNVMVADQDVQIKDDYRDILSQYFLSGVIPANFSSPSEAVLEINGWVQNKTGNLIKDFLSPDAISERSRLILLNAIYFKANWMTTFETAQAGQFHDGTGTETIVDMMYQVDNYAYSDNNDMECQIVSLPYEDDNFTMLVFLPKEEGLDALDKLSSSLEITGYQNILSGLRETEIELFLPKFKLGYKTQLINALEKSGLNNFFDADFKEINNETLTVDDFLHETKIEVTETGSEAAAISGIELGVRSGSSRGPVIMRVERPFLFVIVDRENQIPLFKGKIAKLPESTISQEENSIIETRQNIVKLVDLDPEERANFENNPEALNVLKPLNCSVEPYINSDMIKFPCPGHETQPIEDYIAKHGDTSRIGVNGEVAELSAGIN